MTYDIIIIGGGAAGLMAMKELLEAGHSVCLLEAAAVPGGRIATNKTDFDQPVEEGAEFVHGRLPLTLNLLKKAGIHYVPVEGGMTAVHQGMWKKNQPDKHWNSFMRQLDKLRTDTTIAQLLEEHFSGEQYASLRSAVQRYAEGFDLANISKASAMAAKLEWNSEDGTQYRIPGGYVQLVDYLLNECRKKNGEILFNTCVSRIEYSKETVTVITTNKQLFQASAVILTVSAGMLQSGAIEFVPVLDPHYTRAISQLGFGDVIKILLQFEQPFWKDRGNIGFILSDEAIPTWWTQLPAHNNLLTGWLGGPPATAKSGETKEALLQSALVSLSHIFDLPVAMLQQQLSHAEIVCWRRHDFIKGGYSYNTTDAATAKQILLHPAGGTVFFSGEAIYTGLSQATVEAALQSGQATAKKVNKHLLAMKA